MYSGEWPWWVVWVAIRPVGSSDAESTLVGELAALGYQTSGTPVRCIDPPLPGYTLEELNLMTGWPLYFRTSADAETFVRSWGRPVVGVAEGSIACDWG
jgi:hypothetical protein